MGAANTYEAYDTIEKRLAPRLEAFVRTGHYAELSAILAKAHATVAATPSTASRRGFCMRSTCPPAPTSSGCAATPANWTDRFASSASKGVGRCSAARNY
jgi:hypothetical protein